MHEYILADRVLQSVIEGSMAARKKPSSADVLLGEFHSLSPATLKEAFKILSKGTPAEGCALRVKVVPGSVVCKSCGFSGALKSAKEDHTPVPVFACPTCGTSLRIETGLELELVKVT